MALDSNTLGIGRAGIGGGMTKRPSQPRIRKADPMAPFDGDYENNGPAKKGKIKPPSQTGPGMGLSANDDLPAKGAKAGKPPKPGRPGLTIVIGPAKPIKGGKTAQPKPRKGSVGDLMPPAAAPDAIKKLRGPKGPRC